MHGLATCARIRRRHTHAAAAAISCGRGGSLVWRTLATRPACFTSPSTRQDLTCHQRAHGGAYLSRTGGPRGAHGFSTPGQRATQPSGPPPHRRLRLRGESRRATARHTAHAPGRPSPSGGTRHGPWCGPSPLVAHGTDLGAALPLWWHTARTLVRPFPSGGTRHAGHSPSGGTRHGQRVRPLHVWWLPGTDLGAALPSGGAARTLVRPSPLVAHGTDLGAALALWWHTAQDSSAALPLD